MTASCGGRVGACRAALLVFRLGSCAAQELRFINDLDAELARAIELAPRIRAHDDEAGTLGHGRRDVSAGVLDQLGSRLTRERGQRTGDDDCLAREATGAIACVLAGRFLE